MEAEIAAEEAEYDRLEQEHRTVRGRVMIRLYFDEDAMDKDLMRALRPVASISKPQTKPA